MVKEFCYVNGQIVNSTKPQVKVTDLGLLRGYAVFDFIKVIKGQPLFWFEHLKRFRQSAKVLNLKINLTNEEITNLVLKLLIKNKLNKQDASIRLMLTGGEGINGLIPAGENNLIILIEDAYTLPTKLFVSGGKLITASYARLLAEAKTTNYLLAVSLQTKKTKAGAVEILYLNNSLVLEASTSNFFAVFGRKIVTPKTGVLGGITRAKVISLARSAGYKVEERDLKITELKKATETFITATNKDVCPIVKIDNYKIGTGQVGPVVKDLLTRYRAHAFVLK